MGYADTRAPIERVRQSFRGIKSMENRTNTTIGWVLLSGIVALGLASVSARYFMADKVERPEKMGYEIEGVVRSGSETAKEAPIETRLAAADLAKGEATFAKCKSCHTVNQGGAGGIGTNLWGVVGQAIASERGGFAFSDDLKKLGGKWDWTTLDHWLKNPRAMASGTKMSFTGLSDGADRANLIAYLNAQGSHLPLPKAAPAAPAADGKAGDDKAGEVVPAASAAAEVPAKQ